MDLQWHILIPVMLFGSLPQGFFFTYLGVSFWGHQVQGLARKLFIYASLQAFISVFILYLLPFYLRPFFSITIYIALMCLVMSDLKWTERINLGIFALLLSIVNETAIPYLGSIMGVSLDSLKNDPRQMLHFAIIIPLVSGILAWIMQRKSIHPGKAVFRFLKMEGNKYLKRLLLLFVINIMLSSLVFVFLADDKRLLASIIMSLTMVIGLSIFIFTVQAMARTREAAIRTTQEVYIDDINTMFTAIRGQRHDFLNHVQVIRSLLQLRNYEELDSYVKELVGEITEINELLQIGHPALASLIQSKMVSAINRKIDFRYSFEGMDKLHQSIASIDFVKIAANLIDNALDEVMQRPADDRWIEVKGWLDADSFNMSVRNPSRKLSEEELNLLFVPGYSTKEEGHSGLGLSIVKERVNHYKGAVNVKSAAEQGTTFVVKIPLHVSN